MPDFAIELQLEIVRIELQLERTTYALGDSGVIVFIELIDVC